MAAGDVVFFAQFLTDRDNGVHNLSSNTIKLGLVTSAVTPTAATADGRWGAGGSTNFATNEVTPGGNYSAGGPAIASFAATLTGGLSKIDGDDVSITVHASNPTNARWGIIYNDTAAGKNAIGYLDLGADFDMSALTLSVAWNASGIATTDQA